MDVIEGHGGIAEGAAPAIDEVFHLVGVGGTVLLDDIGFALIPDDAFDREIGNGGDHGVSFPVEGEIESRGLMKEDSSRTHEKVTKMSKLWKEPDHTDEVKMLLQKPFSISLRSRLIFRNTCFDDPFFVVRLLHISSFRRRSVPFPLRHTRRLDC